MSEFLTKYQQEFCQYVGALGFSVLEAYCKAFNVRPEQVDDKIRDKAQKLSKRKIIRDEIAVYANEVKDKQIDQLRDAAKYEKVDAMRDLQFIMEKCRNALDVPFFSESEKEEIDDLLRTAWWDSKRDKIQEEYRDLYKRVQMVLTKPLLNTKAGELLGRCIRTASELYDLLNTDIRLTVDDDAKKLITLLQGNSLADLEKIAWQGEVINASGSQIADGTASG